MNNTFRFLIISFALQIFNAAFSFGQEIEWQNTIGGSDSETSTAICPTSDGGFICGGMSLSNISGDKTENSNGGLDYWVVKLDALGQIQWQNTIGGAGTDKLYSIRQTSDGGYICGGYSDSNISGDKSENSLGLDDYWVVKLDALGGIQWQNTFGGNNVDWLYSISQTSNGGFICGGVSMSGISGDKTEGCLGQTDYWVVKLDSVGDIEWQNTIGGNYFDWLSSISQTTDGGYICGGQSESSISGDKTENSLGAQDYWVIKLDLIGNIQWQNTIGGNSGEDLRSIAQTSDGGYICGGHSCSNISGDKTENSLGYWDCWPVKLDSLGNVQWENTIGGNYDDGIYSILQSDDGGYICGGTSNSQISGDKFEHDLGLADNWILKLDSFGNLIWQNDVGGTEIELASSISQCNGGFILSSTSRSDISGDKNENSLGLGDFWILKLTNNYNYIRGKTFVDLNNNFQQDLTENAIASNKVTEVSSGRFYFSQQDGSYKLVVVDSGSFSVMPAQINFFNSAPITHSAFFNGLHQTDSLNDFAFQPTGVFNDLCITITPTGSFRSGFNASYVISYENVGTTSLSGDVIFFPWNNVTYVNSSVTPTTISSDSVVWNTGVLAPFQSGSITVTVNVNTGLPIGTLINSTVRIEPVAGDANPGCNYHGWEVYTIGSYDPNDILVSEDTLTTIQLAAQPYLDYIIRFQNTGNDTAFTVKILNPIDTNYFNLSTIEFVNSSHPVNLNWIPWERNMEFKFNNILLPDSNSNEPLSHGFVHYRIKPKTSLITGDNINNNAYIYFDFNSPVATNTAVTKIILPTSVGEVAVGRGQLVVFPNPAKDEITITGYTLQNNQPAVLKVYDVMGKEVFSRSILNPTSQIVNLKSFTSGVYFVQLQTGVKVSRVKFVKQ